MPLTTMANLQFVLNKGNSNFGFDFSLKFEKSLNYFVFGGI